MEDLPAYLRPKPKDNEEQATKRAKILEVVKKAREEGQYELAEHLMSEIDLE